MLPTLILALNPYLTGLLTVLFLFVCVILILTVLIQRPAGGGLSGAFGSGAGSGQTAFGAKTGDALTIATIIMFAVYLIAAVGLNYAARPEIPPAATPTATGTGDEAPVAPVGPAGIPAGDIPGTAEAAGEIADEPAPAADEPPAEATEGAPEAAPEPAPEPENAPEGDGR